MNPRAFTVLVKALSSAVGRASEDVGVWDKEFSRGMRLLVVEAVLSTLGGGEYAFQRATTSVWSLSGLNFAAFGAVRKLFRKDFDALMNSAFNAISLETAAAVLDGVSINVGRHDPQGPTGAVFTPPMLASFLASEVVRPQTEWSELREQQVIDPACGSGSLLLATLSESRKCLRATALSDKRGRLSDWAMTHLKGVDRDQDTATTAACLLGLAIGAETEDVLDSGMIRVTDSLLDPGGLFEVNSYDKVIMNPPWVKTKDLVAEDYSARLRADSRYPLTTQDGRGDLDLYQFFLERAFSLAAARGRIGFIVPGSFLRSARASRLRHLYLTAGHLVRLDEFWNVERMFPIHSMFRFVTGVFDKGATPQAINARFRVQSVEHIGRQHPKRLPPRLFVDENHGTAKPIPEVTTHSGLALLRKISAHQPALGSPNNPWAGRFRFRREFDMTGDRHRFIESDQVKCDAIANGSLWPVYEGRMVHQFDSSAKTYHNGRGRSAEWSVWLPGQQFRPQFYVNASNIAPGLIGHVSKPRAGFCDVTGHANERTILAALIPAGAVCGNKVPTLEMDDPRLHYLWVSIANSFVVDWYLRRSVTTTINYHYLLGTPFPWVAPTNSTGRTLIALSQSIASRRSCDPNDLWWRANIRADIDCVIAMLFGLEASDLNDILEDFPLLDRGQPSPNGDPSTITRDLVLARFARMVGQTDSQAEARMRKAKSVGAIPYVPGELTAQLIANAPTSSASLGRVTSRRRINIHRRRPPGSVEVWD